MRTALPGAVTRHIPTLMVLACSMMPLQCATLERLTLEDMIGKSTAIVRGKVGASWAAMSGPIVYTHYTIQVTERYKGAAGATVEVTVPGGTTGTTQQTFAGAPKFATGEELVFFLWAGKSGQNQVIGLTQGLFAVEADGTTDPFATRPASRELMLDAGGRPVKDQTLRMRLSELRSKISSRLAAGSQAGGK